jgi:nuclear pore complex protein Nup107
MTRFFAHLCLYLQMIDIPVSPLAIQIILEAYLQVLEARPSLMPLHASLSNRTVVIERWAAFPHCDVRRGARRQRCRALRTVLDFSCALCGSRRAACGVAARERARTRRSACSHRHGGAHDREGARQPPVFREGTAAKSGQCGTGACGRGGDATGAVHRVDCRRERDIRHGAGAGERDLEVPTRCADFTSSSVARGEYSVVLGTARGRVDVARLLLDLLPPELAAISTPEERAAEYLDYRQFFIAWETLERVAECQSLEAPQTSRDTRAAWLRDYTVRVSFSLLRP